MTEHNNEVAMMIEIGTCPYCMHSPTQFVVLEDRKDGVQRWHIKSDFAETKQWERDYEKEKECERARSGN